MEDTYAALRAKITARHDLRAGVIGLGYVGLPLAMAFVDAGYDVLGYDIDGEKVRRLEAGSSYIGDVPDARLRAATNAGRFKATTDVSRLTEADVITICVPTPLLPNKDPDMSFLVNTAKALAPHLRRGQLIIVASTVYPGATRDVVRPLLEKSGLKCGADFFLAFSPERVDPGNHDYPLPQIPTVVGGLDDRATELAAAFYENVVVKVVRVSSAEAAEMAKLLENIYRAVNIALVNELKIICHKMGLDVFEVIEAAATKPYGFQRFNPGPGVGGHCIPLDPYYLAWRARRAGVESYFVELAGQVNDAMPRYVCEKLKGALAARGVPLPRSRVLVLGVAYKPDVDDLRESPALEIMALLQAAGAEVAYHDPYTPRLPRLRKYDFRLSSVGLTPEEIRRYDAVVIATDHTNVDYDMVLREARLVVDTRGVARRLGVAGPQIVAA